MRIRGCPQTSAHNYAGGVEPGTTVLFGGIAVGKVTAVHPDKQDPTRIEISLGVKEGTGHSSIVATSFDPSFPERFLRVHWESVADLVETCLLAAGVCVRTRIFIAGSPSRGTVQLLNSVAGSKDEGSHYETADI